MSQGMIPKANNTTQRQPEAGPSVRLHVWKRCSDCGAYFEGGTDGEYRCPACRQRSAPGRAAVPSPDAPLDAEHSVAA